MASQRRRTAARVDIERMAWGSARGERVGRRGLGIDMASGHPAARWLGDGDPIAVGREHGDVAGRG